MLRVRLVACLLFVLPTPRDGAPLADSAVRAPHRVLFVGNSLTYANDLPGTLAALAAAAGKEIVVGTVARPGYALVDHFTAPTASDAMARIRGGPWEYVVLQQGPTSRRADGDTLVITVRQLATHIRSAGARPALYMVWPAHRDSANFDRVRDSYQRAACGNDGAFWPAGEAWRAALRRDPGLRLYDEDAFHPAPLGTYLVALVMYEQITGGDARALPARAVVAGRTLPEPSSTIRALQETAHATNARFAAQCAA